METYTPSAAVRAPAGPPSARGGRASPPELRSSAASRDGRSGDGTSCSVSATSFRSTCAPSRVLAHQDTQPYFSHDDAPPHFLAAGAADAVAAAVAAEANPSTSTLSTSAPLDLWHAHRAQAMAHFTAAARELPGESLCRRSPDLDSDDDDDGGGGGGGAECHAARKAAAWLLFDCGANTLSPLSPPPPAASARLVNDFSGVGAYPDHHLNGRDASALAAAPFPGDALAMETLAVGAEEGGAAMATTTAVWRAETTSSPPSLRQSQARADADREGEPDGDEEGSARSGSDGDAPLPRNGTVASTAALVFCPTPATRTHAFSLTPHARTSSVRPAPTPTPAAGGDTGTASSVDASRWRDALLRGRAGAMPTFSPRDPARGGDSGGDAEADVATESDEDSSVWEDWADDVFDEGGAMRLAELALCVLRLLRTLVLRFACCGCVCVTVPLRWLLRRRPCVCGGAVCILCLECLPLAGSDGEEEADGSAAEDDHLLPDTRGADHRTHNGAWAAPHRLWHAYHGEERGERLPPERHLLISSRAAAARPLHLAGPDSDGEDGEDMSDVAHEGEGWAGSTSSGSRPSRTRHTISARATLTPSSLLPQLPPSSRGAASATAKHDGESGRQADLTSRPVPATSALPSTRRLRFAWVPTSVRHAAVSCRRATHRTIDFYRVWKRPRHEAAASPTDRGGIDHHRRTASADPGAAGLAESAGATAGTPPPPLPRRPPPRRGTLMRVPWIGRVYVTLQYAALAMLTATVAMLGVFAYRRTRVAEVHDMTACNTFSFEDRVQADLTFSLVCFMLNGLLTVRFAVRAVRYEKGGLLVVQAVVVALQVCRAAYFLPFVATSYMRAAPASVPPPTAAATTLAGLAWPSWGRHQSRLALGRGEEALRSGGGRGVSDGEWARRGVFGSSPSSSSSSAFSDSGSAPTRDPGRPLEPVLEPLFALTCVGVASSVVLFVVSALLTPWVHASFGWRQYAQGIVQVSLSRVRQRLTVLRTCVQLDSVTTANAYLATVFLLDNWSDQGVLLLATGSVLALHYVVIAALRRAQHWWPLLCAAAVLVTVSGYYAAVIGSTLQADHQLRSRSSAPWFSTCYTEQLPRCLDGISPLYRVSIYRDCQEGDVGGGWSSGDGRSSRTHLASLSHAVQAAVLTRSSHASLVLHAVPVPPAVQRVRNTTHTFLPTEGTFADYFQISWCNATCFADEEAGSHHALQRGIAGCCAQYGQCRLKDAYRTYAVLLLLLLVIASFVVRVVLLAVAWGRWVEEDDKSIELFLRERQRWRSAPPRAGHRQRQQQLQRRSRVRSTRLAAPASMPPQQPHCRRNSGSPSALVGSPPFSSVSSSPVQDLGRAGLPVPQTPPPPPAGDALVASSGRASPPPPPPLVWSSEQYALWRRWQGAQARVR